MSLLDEKAVRSMVAHSVEKDINDLLDKAVEETLTALKSKVRQRVASRIMAKITSEYDIEWDRQNMLIRVKIQ